ncbi:hypothetical protein ACF3DV_17130 [Chlorogloeopsis fritschii PCC 9212]|uniref:hypothetical protein n=1 Tax=Chlorogloeopsis fritschii TaxID=1124 RepID=UPI000304FCC3|nr:hypothetical protein [Chlorogloeopsis fritschii]
MSDSCQLPHYYSTDSEGIVSPADVVEAVPWLVMRLCAIAISLVLCQPGCLCS